MGKINILTPNVYNLISAGEVVERPASVIKELVENSIDAGASQIDIAIENGGISLIRISDNGLGIDADDIKAVFLPHATSKLEQAEDLNTIATLGFRGEALASISAVSEVSLISKTENTELASSLTVKGGLYGEIKKVAGKKGTVIEVRNLFYNTPARMKFLKKPKSEERMVVSKIQELILANSEISFSLTVEGKLLFSTDGNSLECALHSIYDRATMRELMSFSTNRGAFMLEGYFSKPTYSKANRTYQTIIINGRVVNCASISTAVERAYASYLMKRSYPMFIIDLVLPFDMVDVNVHPAKSEVRFSDNNAIFGFVFSAMRDMLDSMSGKFKTLSENYVAKDIEQPNFSSVSFVQNSNQNNAETCNETTKILSAGADIDSKHLNEISKNECGKVNEKVDEEENIELNSKSCYYRDTNCSDDFANSFNHKIADISSFYGLSQRKTKTFGFNDKQNLFNPYATKFEKDVNIENKENTENIGNNENTASAEKVDRTSNIIVSQHQADWMKNYTIIGQLFDTYIILQNGNDAYIVDQHAAHERILFDKLVSNIDNSYSQPMLFPYEVKVNGEEFEYFKIIVPALERLGFEIQICEDCKFEITAIPLVLLDLEIDDFIKYLFMDLSQQKELKLDDILIDKLAQIACKSAIKGGNTLSNEQIEYILDVFFGENGNLPTQCPHGRPAVVKMSKFEIEKMFKRKL